MTALTSPGFRSVGFRDMGSPAGGLQPVPGAIAWYRCDEGAGQILHDCSGNGNHGTLGSTAGVDTNDPQWNAQGLVFGGDDWIDCPNILNTSGAFSLVVTATHSSLSGYSMLLSKLTGTGNNNYGFVLRRNSGNMEFLMMRPDGAEQLLVNVSPAIGVPTTYVITYDGNIARFVSSFTNFGSNANNTKSGVINAPAAAQHVTIGAYSHNHGFPYLGTVHGVWLSPFAVSNTQVVQQYTYEKYRLAPKGVILP